MGSTGHSIYSKSNTGNVNHETFGIPGAVNYKGKLPIGSGLDKPGNNRITLKVPLGKNNVFFQFKISSDEKLMTITAFKDGRPEVKCKVRVDANKPSLDKVIISGNASEKNAAVKMKNLFSQSESVKENQLGQIASRLKSKHVDRNIKEGKKR